MSALSNDLSFKPVQVGSQSQLSAAQIEQYNQQGYVSSLPLYNKDEVDANRRYVDDLFNQLGNGDGYSINCYQARCEGIWDLCTSPAILDYVEDIIGPNIVCWASHFFCKMPFDSKAVPWHQDAVYWNLSPARTVTVWLAIDDADEGNSAMEFIPASHNNGILKWQKPKGNVVSVLDREIVGVSSMDKPISNNLRAGQISLHADMLAHGSKPNLSDRRRCALTIRYCPPEVRFTNEHWAKGIEPILCRGEDPSGTWKHHERPVGNDVSLQNAPGNFGGN